ncbi:MAG: hypothetical protein ACI4B3_01535 [Prevotella sp.]
MIRRALYLLVALNIILLALAVSIWLMPKRSADSSTMQDTIRHKVQRVYIDTVVRMENRPVINGSQTNIDDNTPPANRPTASHDATSREITADIRLIAKGNPFYHEAKKVMEGKLEERDAKNRKLILNYCEHLRMSYNTKDIDFIRQVMSDKALIIVGKVVKKTNAASTIEGDERVSFCLKTKAEYVARLEKVFAENKKIDVTFSDFRIMRHPTVAGIYGVILRQRYKSDRYADDGWLFLLWDFRNQSMPVIHVRTWQPQQSVANDNELIGINDFNLE